MGFARGIAVADAVGAAGFAAVLDREPPAWLDDDAGDVCAVGFGGFPLPATRPVVEVLAGLAPGPAAITYLHTLDPAGLDEASRVAVLRAWQAQAGWVAAATQPVIVAVAGPEPREFNEEDWGACEVAAALHLSPGAAQARVDTARALTTTLQATLTALAGGFCSARHASVLAEETAHLGAPLVRAVEAHVLPKAGAQTIAQFTRAVRLAVLAARPEHADLARAHAQAGRRVWVSPEPDGMATLAALLPAEHALAIYQRIDDLAHHQRGVVDAHGVRLSTDQRRADTLTRLLLGAHPAAQPGDQPGAHPGAQPARFAASNGAPSTPTRPRVPVELQIVIDLPTLLGLADHPAHLPGYGPLPAGVARDLATDATWRRLITDPRTGHLLDYGRRTYRPPKPLIDFIRARDRRCRFPGCHQPAARCDLDHAQPYAHGGTTSPTKLRRPQAVARIACLRRVGGVAGENSVWP